VTRLETEVSDERPAGLLVDLQRLRLAPRAVEREHVLAAQPFAIGVGGDERLELGHELAVTAEREVGGDPLLERHQVKVLEPRRLEGRERGLPEIRERGPTPERERPAERRRSFGRRFCPRSFGQRSEALHVELACFDAKEVAAAAGDDSVSTEQLAQRMHGDLESVCRRLGRILAPQCVDQPVAGDDGVRVQEQGSEQGPLTPPADGEDAAFLLDLERAEQPEFDSCAGSLLHRLRRRLRCRSKDPGLCPGSV
jgi:hypothetical protein